MRNKLSIIIVLLAALKFVLPFLLPHPDFQLHRDEYLYYQQGQHLDLGYLENPPLIGLLAFLSSLLGGSGFWIKFWPTLFGALTLVVTIKMVRELGGGLFAVLIAAIGILFTAYMRIHYLFQPNFLDVFFWSLSAYYLIRYINTQQAQYLYLLSMALALGWWSKYSVLFFIAAIALSILLTQHRRLLTQKAFWLSVALGVILIAPNVFWQYEHNWPLVHHMDELRETQLRYINEADFIKEQILMLLPVVFVWIGGLVWLLRHKAYRIIALMYFCVVILLMLGSGKGYYSLGAYPMLLAAGGVWLERISVKRVWLQYGVVLLILALSLPFVPVLLPTQDPPSMAAANQKYGLEKLGILKWEDQQNHPLQQDFADMLGWRELAQKSERFYQQLPDSIKSSTVVYCRNYGLTGASKYYGQDSAFRNKVFTDNGTFLLWIPDSISFNHLLFVGRNIPEQDDEVFQHFEKVTIIDSLNNPLSRQHRTKVIFFQNADTHAAKLARNILNEMKQQFRR